MEEFGSGSGEFQETPVQQPPQPKKSGVWKWIGIGCLGLIIFIVLIVAIALKATSGIVDVADAQLKALKDGDIQKAYSYTSKDFQKTTSLQQFAEFVNRYPSLKEYKSFSFTTREIVNNTGTLKGSLISQAGATTPIEYRLVKENGEWKILAITVQPTGVTPPTSKEVGEAKVVNVILGTRFNPKSNEVLNPSTQFKGSDSTIYCSVGIKNAKKGLKVAALMDFENGRATVGPVETKATHNGDIISAFTFTKPPKGWPAGSYQIKIMLNDNLVEAVSFTVK